MIKSCVTIALVPEIKTGPWIYWNDLELSAAKASSLGFNAIELFTPSADAIKTDELSKLLEKHKLSLAAVGTGAGKVLHGLTITDQDHQVRKKAISFIKDMIRFGAQFGAPAIIGSMQGNIPAGVDQQTTLALLIDALNDLGSYAKEHNTFLIYEPLNRYETNLINTIEAGAAMLNDLETNNVKLLADLFHMNIEEANIEESIEKYITNIGHIHFADSNRRPVGFGHTEMSKIADTLIKNNYYGYVSAEAFPWPDPDRAAEQTIISFNRYFKQ